MEDCLNSKERLKVDAFRSPLKTVRDTASSNGTGPGDAGSESPGATSSDGRRDGNSGGDIDSKRVGNNDDGSNTTGVTEPGTQGGCEALAGGPEEAGTDPAPLPRTSRRPFWKRDASAGGSNNGDRGSEGVGREKRKYSTELGNVAEDAVEPGVTVLPPSTVSKTGGAEEDHGAPQKSLGASTCDVDIQHCL